MFAQLFGYYLLNKNIISPEQLNDALANKNKYAMRFGSLVTNAGYMTAEQVEYVHAEQKRVDRKLGDIAVFMGFLTGSQLDELLIKQQQDDVALADALIAKGYITEVEYGNLIKTFRQELGIDSDINDKNLSRDIANIYELADDHANYISLFVRNVIRFVGDDFALATFNGDKDGKPECFVCQHFTSGSKAQTGIFGSQKAFSEFTKRYMGRSAESLYTGPVDFLNLQNGLYSSNMFAEHGRKLSFGDVLCTDNKVISDKSIVVPLSFPFGKIYISLCF